MDVRGQRILIFGDSLSKHASDSSPEIWDVDAGSNRASGQPGDLLASMLLEQGAQAVRVNARVSRSARNFFGRENFNALLASDQAFLPTKVFVILGTNDIGQADPEAMAKIRDFYKGLGADVWAIGPFQYASSTLNQQAEPVIEMMKGVFGASRYIDPRPITAMVGRGSDGVHFGGDAARVTAQGLQQLILTTIAPKTWMLFAAGLAAAVGGALAYSWWKNGAHLPSPLGRLNGGLPPGGAFLVEDAARAVTKSKRFGDRKVFMSDVHEQLLEQHPEIDISLDDFKRELVRMHQDGNVKLTRADLVAAMPAKKVAASEAKADGASFHFVTLDGLNASKKKSKKDRDYDASSGEGQKRLMAESAGHEYIAPRAITQTAGDHGADPIGENEHGVFMFRMVPSGDIVDSAERARRLGKKTIKGLEGAERCDPNMAPGAFKRCIARQKRAQLGSVTKEASAETREQLRELILRDRDPASMEIAEDLALAQGVKLSRWSSGEHQSPDFYDPTMGSFEIDEPNPEDPEASFGTQIYWQVDTNDLKYGFCRASFSAHVDGAQVNWEGLSAAEKAALPKHARSWFQMAHNQYVTSSKDDVDKKNECIHNAARDAWLIAKDLKKLNATSPLEGEKKLRAARKIIVDTLEYNREAPEELFGLGADRKSWTTRYATREEAYANDRMNENENYVNLDEELKAKRRKFRMLIDSDDSAALDVAEDFAEENEIPISVLTTLSHDQADNGTVKIYPTPRGSNDVYNIWWDVREHPVRKGEWEPELNLGWGTDRALVGGVSDGVGGRVPIKFGFFESAEQARQAAAMNAWIVSKLLRTLPPSASISEAEQLLRDYSNGNLDAERYAATERIGEKMNLFGLKRQSSALGSGMGYRVAYSLVTRRDGKIVSVREIVNAPRALTLPEAEAWRRKWGKGHTAWVETMDGQHVPVKGAKRPGGFVDDARPGDVHASLTADYAKPR